MKINGRFITIIIAILFCTITAAFISACNNNNENDNTHDHSYSSEWSYDDDYHWHKADCAHTSEINAKDRHNLIDGKCLVCDYEIKEHSSTSQKQSYDMSRVVFENLTIDYDGQEHSILATNLPDGVSATYEGNGKINAGTYTITAHFKGDSINYNSISDKTATLTIRKLTYDMSRVVFENLTVEYDGHEHSILATNLPDGVSAIYEGNSKTNAGTYTVIAHFIGDSLNYNSIPNKTAVLIVTRVTHVVTFKQEGQVDIVRKVLDLSDLTESDIPTPIQKIGYTVVWEKIDLLKVTEDIIVNAVDIPKQFGITYFDRGSGSTFSGQFEENYPTFHTYDSITRLVEPVKEGYIFTGWFNNSTCDGIELTILDAKNFTDDITLYARWAATITFNTDGGTEIASITQNPGTPISEPETLPLKKSFIFVKWQIDDNDYVFDIMPDVNITLNAVWKFFEDGTEFYPYIISNKDQLMEIEKLDSENGSTYFELANDIDLDGSSWSPIIKFYGIIDGKNYKIFNFTILTIPKISSTLNEVTRDLYCEYGTGLFCSTGSNSVIQNLGIDDFNISATLALNTATSTSHDLYVGGLAGQNCGLIENCYSTCEISIHTNNSSTSYLYIGGLVGRNSGRIDNSYNHGQVYGTGRNVSTGGIAGKNSGTVSFCWTSGQIETRGTAYAYSGGLVGKNSGTVSFCWASGQIETRGTAYAYSGGLVATNSGTIRNCYSTSIVKANADLGNDSVDVYGGGLVGDNMTGNIYFSYATGDVTVYHGYNSYSYGGGLVGRHKNGLVLGCFATGSIEGSSSKSYLGGIAGLSNEGNIAMSYGYVGQVITGKPGTLGCTFLQLNDKEFYLNELGWNADDWDLSNLDFLNGLYPKLAK